MDFTLRPDRSVPHEIRRVVREQLDGAMADLTRPDDGGHGGVHDARKRLKAIRAVLRLVRSGLRGTYARENVALRDVARRLSAVRDAQALLETLDRLTTGEGAVVDAESVRPLRSRLRRRLRAIERSMLTAEDGLAPVLNALAAARRRVARWPLRATGFEAVGPGLQATYGRGLGAFAEARDEGTPEAYHEWRKQVKYHRHQVELLRILWPAVLGGALVTLEDLSDLLGDHHDLEVLRGLLREREDLVGSSVVRSELLRVTGREGSLIEDQALYLGHLAFAEAPGRFRGRVEAYWNAWPPVPPRPT